MKKRGALKKIFSVVLIVILLISSGTNIADAEEQGSTLLENSFLLTIEDERIIIARIAENTLTKAKTRLIWKKT